METKISKGGSRFVVRNYGAAINQNKTDEKSQGRNDFFQNARLLRLIENRVSSFADVFWK